MSSDTLSLPETLRIDTVMALQDELQRTLDLGEAISVNAEPLERIDFCGLQALAVFSAEARRREIPVRWQDPSESLLQAARLTGFTTALGLPG